MAELTDQERVALLTSRLGLPEGALQHDVALQALRHGSYVHERSLAPGREQLGSNERLEFLGDAVLGYLIARRMYDRFPDAPEGDLTRLRASLVREESLAIVARQLGLGELLLLGRGEQRSGGREDAGRLADALEAVIAAVYLSCGMERAPEASVEHIGSTAVPGLDAKPIVDLLVGVPLELSGLLKLPDYEACGEAGVPGRLYFRKRGPVAFNAQVVVKDGPLWRDALAVRDYLRAHPEEVARYAQAKRSAI